jgi:hypothetical protein
MMRVVVHDVFGNYSPSPVLLDYCAVCYQIMRLTKENTTLAVESRAAAAAQQENNLLKTKVSLYEKQLRDSNANGLFD